MTGDHMLAVILRRRMMHDTVKAFIKAQQPKSREEVTMLIREQRLGFMPLSFLHYAIWYLFLGYHALAFRSEAHTSELQSLMRISYAVFCLTKNKILEQHNSTSIQLYTQ